MKRLLILLIFVLGLPLVTMSLAANDDPACGDTVTFLSDLSGQPAGYVDSIVSDVLLIEAFWQETYPQQWGQAFTSPCVVEYAPASVPYQNTCGITPEMATQNAWYCSTAHAVLWDGPTFYHPLYNDLGDKSVTFITAHEYGHAAQFLSGQIPARSVNRELQADCYAGAYLRYAVDQGAIQQDDFQEIVTIVAAVGQSRVGTRWFERTHGTAVQRQRALRLGYDSGVAGCQFDFESWLEAREQGTPLLESTPSIERPPALERPRPDRPGIRRP